jgi:hypothetical protein
MSDLKKANQDKVNKMLLEDILTNKITILLNGNTFSDSLRILRNVESLLRDLSVTNITESFLKKEHQKYKKNLEEEFNLRY